MNVITLRPVWYILSGTMIGLSILFLAIWGLKQGIDFTGGSLLAVKYNTRPTPTEVQQVFDTAHVNLGSIVIQPVGEQEMQFRLRHMTEEEHQTLIQALKKKYADAVELRFDAIGPVIGEELRQKAIRGLVIVLVAIALYVAYVFRKVSVPVKSWKYGLVTIFTAFHDVIVPIGVFAFLGHFYGIEIGTPFVAAILTILGYSITDTIVVMDRIRENLQKLSGSFEDIVAASVRQTFFRSFSTSITTLLVLFAIHFFGGESLRDFTLTLIIGIATGTYSSIFIASPLLVSWDRWSRKP
ncbi:protein translocase subunit SecF [Candidatus Uhrbacteria bacterium]|nr:protein translocase subunit SecF [Candidatus Uhrbacteria bacterium]